MRENFNLLNAFAMHERANREYACEFVDVIVCVWGRRKVICCRCNCVGWFWYYWYRLCAQSRFALNNSQSQCALKFVRVCNKRYRKLHKQNHCRRFFFSLSTSFELLMTMMMLLSGCIFDCNAHTCVRFNAQIGGKWNFVWTFHY